eukprot:567297-Pyramimonas_sp.AAC.1
MRKISGLKAGCLKLNFSSLKAGKARPFINIITPIFNLRPDGSGYDFEHPPLRFSNYPTTILATIFRIRPYDSECGVREPPARFRNETLRLERTICVRIWRPIRNDFKYNFGKQKFRGGVSGKSPQKIVLQNRVQNRGWFLCFSGEGPGDSETPPSTHAHHHPHSASRSSE